MTYIDSVNRSLPQFQSVPTTACLRAQVWTLYCEAGMCRQVVDARGPRLAFGLIGDTKRMWYDQLPTGRSWNSLWSGYILCGQCHGIRRAAEPCPACGNGPYALDPQTLTVDGREVTIVPAFAGAEGRYEDWMYLQMLEREWKRPPTDADQ